MGALPMMHGYYLTPIADRHQRSMGWGDYCYTAPSYCNVWGRLWTAFHSRLCTSKERTCCCSTLYRLLVCLCMFKERTCCCSTLYRLLVCAYGMCPYTNIQYVFIKNDGLAFVSLQVEGKDLPLLYTVSKDGAIFAWSFTPRPKKAPGGRCVIDVCARGHALISPSYCLALAPVPV